LKGLQDQSAQEIAERKGIEKWANRVISKNVKETRKRGERKSVREKRVREKRDDGGQPLFHF
jgi:hypothetical protein